MDHDLTDVIRKIATNDTRIFICHASEDKRSAAEPIAQMLRELGIKVWYDDFSLKLGDNLRQSIDQGLRISQFGIVIISPNFFSKKWPQAELDALFELEMAEKNKILPIWHDIDKRTVSIHSPLLATKIAASTSEGWSTVIRKILESIGLDGNLVKILGKEDDLVDPYFRRVFAEKLVELTNLIGRRSAFEVNDLVDVILMLFKEKIDKWDVPSVKFATRELYMRLYKLSENKGLSEMYAFFQDLFFYAYAQRKHLIGSMIGEIRSILFQSWIPDGDVEKGEKACKVLLRLGIDFAKKDLEVTRECAGQIDNLAGDMFEPEILSKEILLTAYIYENVRGNEANKIVEKLVEWIRFNDEYSWDAEIKNYLVESIYYAEAESEEYGIELQKFTRELLLPVLTMNINRQVNSFIEYFEEIADEKKDFTYISEDLEEIILAYETVRPKIATEIKQKIMKKRNPKLLQVFDKIINDNKLLVKIYDGSAMITTFREFITFLEVNSDEENRGIGNSAYSLLMIDFARKISDKEKKKIEELARKYSIQEELEIEANELMFEVDSFVYHDGIYDSKKLISFLKELNKLVDITKISVGMSFEFRRQKKQK